MKSEPCELENVLIRDDYTFLDEAGVHFTDSALQADMAIFAGAAGFSVCDIAG